MATYAQAEAAQLRLEATYKDEEWFIGTSIEHCGFGSWYLALRLSERPDELFPATVGGVRLVVQVRGMEFGGEDEDKTLN